MTELPAGSPDSGESVYALPEQPVSDVWKRLPAADREALLGEIRGLPEERRNGLLGILVRDSYSRPPEEVTPLLAAMTSYRAQKMAMELFLRPSYLSDPGDYGAGSSTRARALVDAIAASPDAAGTLQRAGAFAQQFLAAAEKKDEDPEKEERIFEDPVLGE